MALPQLWRPPPGRRGLDEFLYHNWQDHLAVISVLRRNGANLQTYLLWPVSERHFQAFLDQHQEAHDSINAALNTGGTDLSSFDINNPSDANDWYFRHFSEHQAWAKALGAPL